MEKNSGIIKNSKRTNIIIAWWLIIITISIIGALGFSSRHKLSISHDDYQTIAIEYNRFYKSTGEDPMYTIFSKDDEESFLIDNIVARQFDESQFKQKVTKGDTLQLMVLKYDYENKTDKIETLGVKKDDRVFLDFEKSFQENYDNYYFGYIISLICLPGACVLVVVFFIWLIFYNKRLILKRKFDNLI